MTPDQERDYLLDHVRHPRRSGDMDDAHAIGECKNPACGDQVKIFLKTHSSHIEVLQQSSGCTICLATTSLMSELVHDKPFIEIKRFIFLMQSSIRDKNIDWPKELQSLEPLKRMRESPMKIPCTLVPWVALEKALKALPEDTEI